MKKEELIIHYDEKVPEDKRKSFICGIYKMAKGYPLQYLTNSKEFMKMNFFVNQDVLVPRADTECLVEEAISKIKGKDNILELCTGSGIITISLAKYVEGISITATDISLKALEVARINADKLAKDKNICFLQSDLFENVSGKFDVIIANPPYIKTNVIPKYNLQYEPRIALDGGEDGLLFYKKIIEEGYRFLNDLGFILLEIGFDQREEVTYIANNTGMYKDIYCKKDLFGNDRVLVLQLRKEVI